MEKSPLSLMKLSSLRQSDRQTQRHRTIMPSRDKESLLFSPLLPSSHLSSLLSLHLVSFTHYGRQNSAIRMHLPAVAERQLNATVAQPETISSGEEITAFL